MLTGLDLIIINSAKALITSTTLVGIPVGGYILGIGGLLIVNQILSIKIKNRAGRKV